MALTRMPALSQAVGERKDVYNPGGGAASYQSPQDITLKRPKESEAKVIL